MVQKQGQKPSEPKRWMILPLFVLYGLSMTIGASMYVLPGIIASKSGLYTPLSFLLPAITIGLTGFSYAEFATRHPMAGGAVSYVDEAFGFTPFAVAVALLLIASSITSAAFLSIGAAAYSKILIPFLPTKMVLGGVITMVTVAALSGISKSAKTTFLLGFITLSGIGAALVYGFKASPPLFENFDRLLPPFEWSVWKGVFIGSFFAFLPFINFKESTNQPDKIRSPKQTVPIGLTIILLLSLAGFLILSAILVLLVPIGTLAGSEAPLSSLFNLAPFKIHKSLYSLTLVILIGTASLQIHSASKVMFNLAIMGRLPPIFKAMNRFTKTAHFAILTLMGSVAPLVYTASLTTLAEVTSALFLVLFIVINASLIKLKWGGSGIPNFNAFSVYFWIPILGLVSSCILLTIGVWGKFLS